MLLLPSLCTYPPANPRNSTCITEESCPLDDRRDADVAHAAGMQGLENEYDRLLASHDELQERLARLSGSHGADGGRKDW